MTFFTGTVSEELYVMPAPGAALTNSTTKTVISANSTTNPPYQLPSLVWPPSYAVGRGMHITARGGISTSGSPGTLTIGCWLDPTQNSTTSQILLAGTGAFSVAAGLSNGEFELEFDVTIASIGVSAGAYTENVYTGGVLTVGSGANAATTASTPYMVGSGTSAIANNPATPYFVEVWAQWGTASSSNSIQLTQLLIGGLN
jgi:hypothetical protein